MTECERATLPPDTYYTPERIDAILRQWPAFVSRSEGMRSTQPDALRPAKGRRGDALRSADTCADVSKAMVLALSVGGLEWRTVELRRLGWTFGQMAASLHLGKQTVYEAYQLALIKMAVCLGWEPPSEEPE